MNKHLDEYLCKTYPQIFADRNKPMTETCMCWGFDCGDGWFFLIDQLCSSIRYHIAYPQYVAPTDIRARLKTLWNKTVWNWIIYPLTHKLPYETFQKIQKKFLLNYDYIPGPPIPQVVAVQVKEKFGGLRFYINGGDDYCRDIISFAESLSYSICEVCGRTDELVATTQKGWNRTTCPCCATSKKVHEEARNEKYIALWKKVHDDNIASTLKSIFPDKDFSSKKTSKKKSKK
jgi:hypothetical protein